MPAIAGVPGIRESGDQSVYERLQQVLSVGERLVLVFYEAESAASAIRLSEMPEVVAMDSALGVIAGMAEHARNTAAVGATSTSDPTSRSIESAGWA